MCSGESLSGTTSADVGSLPTKSPAGAMNRTAIPLVRACAAEPITALPMSPAPPTSDATIAALLVIGVM